MEGDAKVYKRGYKFITTGKYMYLEAYFITKGSRLLSSHYCTIGTLRVDR